MEICILMAKGIKMLQIFESERERGDGRKKWRVEEKRVREERGRNAPM